MRIIKDESELPLPGGTRLWQYFIRSLIEPTALIEGHSGEVFTRKDGQRWEQPAIERDATLDADGNAHWENLRPRGAWFDSAIYHYAKAKAA